jgi:hypothetical protein
MGTMSKSGAGRLAALVASQTFVMTGIAVATPAHAVNELFFEETASSFWAVPHDCADGSVVSATLLVLTTRDFESPETADPDPTVRVQYQAVCPDDSSFGWAGTIPATIASTANLKSVDASGAGTVRDIFGITHAVAFDVTWAAVGPLEVEVNTAGSKRKVRQALSTGLVTFDGEVLVEGVSNHPTRPAPFIRVDTEK